MPIVVAAICTQGWAADAATISMKDGKTVTSEVSGTVACGELAYRIDAIVVAEGKDIDKIEITGRAAPLSVAPVSRR